MNEFAGIEQASSRCAGLYSKTAPLNMSAIILPRLKKIHNALADICEHIEN